MIKPFSFKGNRAKKAEKSENDMQLRKRILHIGVVAVCAGLVATGIWWLFSIYREESAARSEYEGFAEIFQDRRETGQSPAPGAEEPGEGETEGEGDEPRADQRRIMEELAEINPDLAGWISIENHIEYPVVRGTSNDKYIYTTFAGEQNKAGAIFMDYRNRGGFDDNVAILFGHKSRDGSMFAPLVNYLDSAFLRENPLITITTRDEEVLTYRVFAAKQTDAWDAAYDMVGSGGGRAASAFPNAPQGAERFLLLSTCTASSDRDERIIVYAALEG